MTYQRRLVQSECRHDIPTVQCEVEHVFEQFLTSGFTISRKLWRKHMIARRETVKKRVLRKEPTCSVHENQRGSTAGLKYADFRPALGLDFVDLHNGSLPSCRAC